MPQLDGVARLDGADGVQLAVDVHAVGALVVDHLPGRVLEHEPGVLAAQRLVVDGDVVVLAATDLHLGAHEEELLAAHVAGEAEQARHLALGQVADLDLRGGLHQIGDADDGGRAAHAGGGRRGAAGREERQRRRVHRRGRRNLRLGDGRRPLPHRRRDGRAADFRSCGRRRGGELHPALQAEVVIADLDQIAFLDLGGGGDPLAVDAHAVVGPEVLDHHRAVVPLQPRVAARDVSLGKLDGIPVLAPDGDLFAQELDDGLPALVVLDDELHEVLKRFPAWGVR